MFPLSCKEMNWLRNTYTQCRPYDVTQKCAHTYTPGWKPWPSTCQLVFHLIHSSIAWPSQWFLWKEPGCSEEINHKMQVKTYTSCREKIGKKILCVKSGSFSSLMFQPHQPLSTYTVLPHVLPLNRKRRDFFTLVYSSACGLVCNLYCLW